MSAQPPSYDTATHHSGPTDHAHETRTQHLAHSGNLTDYSSSDDSDSGAGRIPGTKQPRRKPTQEEIDERMSIDDEERELPEGWTRCFDKNVSGASGFAEPRFLVNSIADSDLVPPRDVSVRSRILRRHPSQPSPLDLDPPIRRPRLHPFSPRHSSCQP